MVGLRQLLQRKATFDLDVITSSYRELRNRQKQVSNRFFKSFLKKCPDLEPLFEGTDPEEQRSVLIETMDHLVRFMGQEDKLRDLVHELADKGDEFGFKEEHYLNAIEALHFSFVTVFGQGWDDRLDSHWSAFFDQLKGYLKEHLKASVVPVLEEREKPRKNASKKLPIPPLKKKSMLSTVTKTSPKIAPIPKEEPLKNQARGEPSQDVEFEPEELTLKEVANDLAKELLVQSLNEEANDKFKESARQIAREILREALKEEAESVLRETANGLRRSGGRAA